MTSPWPSHEKSPPCHFILRGVILGLSFRPPFSDQAERQGWTQGLHLKQESQLGLVIPWSWKFLKYFHFLVFQQKMLPLAAHKKLNYAQKDLKPHMLSIAPSMLPHSRYKVFISDNIWPLPKKTNRVHLLTISHPHAIMKVSLSICHTYTAFSFLTSVDSWPPLQKQ